jgi:general secretion pathway protein I
MMQFATDAERRGAGRARARGFTLIEVLAALVIVALGMLGVIQAVTQTARNGTYLREKTLAHWIAMNVITENRLLATPPEVAETSDEVDFAGERWRWTMTVTQTEVQSLRRMDVSVRPAGKPDGEALITVTGFYGTAVGAAGGGSLTWSDAGTGSTNGADEEADGEGSSEPPAGEADTQPNESAPKRRDRNRSEEEED